MGRSVGTIAPRFSGKRFLRVPALLFAVALLAGATAAAETGRIKLKVTDKGIPVQAAGVSVHTASGEPLGLQSQTNRAGIATFLAAAGAYTFCVVNGQCYRAIP